MNQEEFDDNTRSFVPLTKGAMVSHYRIVEKIGAGGMGDVYLADDTKLKRNIALKFLAVDQIKNNAVLQQFTQEARAAARLQHPNIITVHEINEYEGVPYIAMAYIEGQSLKELSNNKSLSITDIVEIGIQIARGLTIAHERGITHRDLKPGNIIIDVTGTVKILDFGLAVLSNIDPDQDSGRTVTNNPFDAKIAGTISYMAPEQLLGQEINSSVDIFAFGIIMYELIAKKHPFAAPTTQEISARILRDTPAEFPAERPNVPYDLSRIVTRCLKKKSDRRFQTARDICNELEELSDKLKQNEAIIVTGEHVSNKGRLLVEESFALTTDMVRKLSYKDPRMIGSQLVYIDNCVSSDTLIVFLHGIGKDHRQFAEVLQQLPFRAISLSLFGFDLNAQLRLPLSLNDHSLLIYAWLKDVTGRLRPRHLILAGSSSGADHFLNFLSSKEYVDIKVAGLLSLGCNLHLEDCFATSKFANLTSGDEKQILSTIVEFSSKYSSLQGWLLMHNYLLAAFTKFGTNTESLKQYSADIIAPFADGGWSQFPIWYRNCVRRVPYVRFVFDADGYKSLDRILEQHLESNVLGDDFEEDTIVRDPVSHIELGQSEVVCKHTLDFIDNIEAG